MKTTKRKKKSSKNKVTTSNRDPEKITPVGDAAPDADSKEIHVGGNYLYYEGITWQTLRERQYEIHQDVSSSPNVSAC